jgi:hypothetical protein
MYSLLNTLGGSMADLENLDQIYVGRSIGHDSRHFGYIYAFGMSGTDFVKIGKTRTMLSLRLEALQAGNPCVLRPIAAWAVDYRLRTVERHVHQLLHKFHYRSEWFLLPGFTAHDFIPLVQQAISRTEEEEALFHRMKRSKTKETRLRKTYKKRLPKKMPEPVILHLIGY